APAGLLRPNYRGPETYAVINIPPNPLRLKRREQDVKDKTEQRDHCAPTLGDSLPQSIRIAFSVHTGHPTYVTQRPKKSTRRESAISNHYTDIVVCSSRNVAMMASGSMRSRNSILTCRAATSPSRPTINLAAIGRK